MVGQDINQTFYTRKKHKSGFETKDDSNVWKPPTKSDLLAEHERK